MVYHAPHLFISFTFLHTFNSEEKNKTCINSGFAQDTREMEEFEPQFEMPSEDGTAELVKQGTGELDVLISGQPSPEASRQASRSRPTSPPMSRQVSPALVFPTRVEHNIEHVENTESMEPTDFIPTVVGLDQPLPSKADTEFLAPKSAEREAREKSTVVETLVESAMVKLETKLDLLLTECRSNRMQTNYMDRTERASLTGGLPSEDLAAFWEAKKPRRKNRGKKMIHPEAFRQGWC